MNLHRLLGQRLEAGRPVRVGLIGAGKFGSMFLAQIPSTQGIEVDTKAGATPSEVLIDLKSTDRQPGGGTVTHRFRGAWTVIWDAGQKRWLLDKARIEQVS